MKNSNQKFKLFFCIALLFFLLSTCKSTPKSMEEQGGIVIKSGDGWLNDNTYQMTIAGGWPRDKYYIENVEEEVPGKQPKSIFLLRQLSKTAAKTIAIRNFKQTMISEIVSETKIKDNITVKDEIINSLQGISIAPISEKEVYSDRGDAEITFHFTAEGLRKNVESAINETVKRYKEESSN